MLVSAVEDSNHGVVYALAACAMPRLRKGVKHARDTQIVMLRQLPKWGCREQFHNLRISNYCSRSSMLLVLGFTIPLAVKPHIVQVTFTAFAVPPLRALVAEKFVGKLRTDDRSKGMVIALPDGRKYPLDKIVVSFHLIIAEPGNIGQRMPYRPVRLFPKEAQ